MKNKHNMFKFHFIRGRLIWKKKLFLKKYSNKLTKVKALAKKNYFANELKNHLGDPKEKTWDMLRSLLSPIGQTSKCSSNSSDIGGGTSDLAH